MNGEIAATADGISLAKNVELDAVQRGGFVLRAWRQVFVGGSAFGFGNLCLLVKHSNSDEHGQDLQGIRGDQV